MAGARDDGDEEGNGVYAGWEGFSQGQEGIAEEE
eukprot:CAMPEP_0176490336 /NCGR_PEP_ID=MMETSP0200_2-20121128/7811_1 /TAXON_ID=947934 /ORGANISM="Chaetoceros sp., Strain GSL56" /LENGTH=33 /DNA_ID= /DNA_START= /DNA_END= /DNA_ORIENTATION=